LAVPEGFKGITVLHEPGVQSIEMVAKLSSRSWIRCAAIFLLGFTLYDVAVPETCITGLSVAGSSTVVQSAHQDGDSGTCQFEEDCLACAHVLPGSSYVLAIASVVIFSTSDPILPVQVGISTPHYHPPRA
jgi:hypothetical protein